MSKIYKVENTLRSFAYALKISLQCSPFSVKLKSSMKEKIEHSMMQKLKTFCENDSNILFAILFGSTVDGRRRTDSDIDVAIYFKKPLEGMDLLDMINSLSELAGKEVDIVVLNNASAFLRHQVMKNGIVILIKDYVIYRQFREKTICDYDEYKYISKMNIYD